MVWDCTCSTKSDAKPQLLQDRCLICPWVNTRQQAGAKCHPHRRIAPTPRPPGTFTERAWRTPLVTAWAAAVATNTCMIRCRTGIRPQIDIEVNWHKFNSTSITLIHIFYNILYIALKFGNRSIYLYFLFCENLQLLYV